MVCHSHRVRRIRMPHVEIVSREIAATVRAAAQRTSAKVPRGRARSIRARGPRRSHVADAVAVAALGGVTCKWDIDGIISGGGGRDEEAWWAGSWQRL